MSRFTTYAIREISSSFLFLSILLSGILWLGQGLRHIDLLTSDNVTIETYISYILLLLPKIILLTFPICAFLSVLFNLNRFRNDSELIILGTSGKPEIDILIKPIFFFSLSVYLVVFLFSIYITPNSLKEIRYKIIDIRSSGIHSSLLKEKKFISPVDTLTIFLQEKDGENIKGLLIHDQSNLGNPQTYIAEQGEFIENREKNLLRLYNGSIQTFSKDNDRISEVTFESYDLDLSPYSKKENTYIYADELSTNELFNNIKKKSIKNLTVNEKEQFAELHSRIINPIYIFCYALLPLLIVKFSRRPDDSWVYPIIVVATIAFIIQILQITLSNLLVERTSLIAFNYSFPLMLFTLMMIILYLPQLNFGKNRHV